MLEEIKDKVIKLGFDNENGTLEGVRVFLKEKYRFNVRDVDSFTTRGAWNDSRPAIDEIPDKFFLKEYSEKMTEEQYFDEVILLAIHLINKFG